MTLSTLYKCISSERKCERLVMARWQRRRGDGSAARCDFRRDAAQVRKTHSEVFGVTTGSTESECDRVVAHSKTKMTVLSEHTDFMICDGPFLLFTVSTPINLKRVNLHQRAKTSQVKQIMSVDLLRTVSEQLLLVINAWGEGAMNRWKGPEWLFTRTKLLLDDEWVCSGWGANDKSSLSGSTLSPDMTWCKCLVAGHHRTNSQFCNGELEWRWWW